MIPGAAALKRKDWVAAERAFQEALRLRPFDANIIVNLALTLEQLGRRDETANLWIRLQQLDPELCRRARRRLASERSRRIRLGVFGFVLVTVLSATVSLALLPGNWDVAWVTAVEQVIALALAAAALGVLVGMVVLLRRLRR